MKYKLVYIFALTTSVIFFCRLDIILVDFLNVHLEQSKAGIISSIVFAFLVAILFCIFYPSENQNNKKQ